MTDSEWDSVTVLRKKPQKSSQLKSEQAVNQARRSGAQIETSSKYGAASNKQHGTSMNTAKLDRETEELKHEKITPDVGRLIQQGRQAKNWTQKDLATRINEKPQVIQEYEQGKAVPNQNVLGKIERAIGLRLRGKDKGQIMQPIVNKKK
ncbi:endothelial differentiation-related factor 1 [Procambarus clarkii]|uniref:endothelial differentiation-related factor 1 n=1 Tax=Procambarus clarkii TaxID=6728 RepID=UPI001E671D83|nr:endothelial differentiation-related factor 1-like [Procambarus clarkii]